MRAPVRFVLLLVAAVTAGLLAGCGSDDGGGGASFTVVGTEMAFTAPDHVKAGEHVVVFRNDGKLFHELAFRNPARQVVTRRSIAAGQEVEMKVALTAGSWELACFEPGHYEAGMHRELVVDP